MNFPLTVNSGTAFTTMETDYSKSIIINQTAALKNSQH